MQQTHETETVAEPFEKVSCRKHGEVLLSIQNWNLQDGSELIIQPLATEEGKSEVGASGWAKRGSKMRQGSPYGETREAQDEARQAQDGPRGTQYESRGTQNDPKKSQERPKMRQERPNMSQERPKMSQERPTLSQERPQRAKKKKKVTKNDARN